MQVIRRSAFRAVNSASAQITFSARTPFALRQSLQPTACQITRRFKSDDVDSKRPTSADEEEQSSIKSAIDSISEQASETVAGISTYAGQAAESAQESFESVKESVSQTAHSFGAAAGFSAPSGGQRDFQPRNPRDQFQEREPPKPNPILYVGNLSFDVSEEQVLKGFSDFGATSFRLITDDRGLSKGFGYLEFPSTDAATAAMEARNQEEFRGRRLNLGYQIQRPIRAANAPSNTLYVGNLAFEMSDADLNKLFKDIKGVVDVRVAIDRRTGQPRGFAHAEFKDVESATDAAEVLKTKELYGRALKVDFSGAAHSGPSGGQDRAPRGNDYGSNRPQSSSYGGGRGGSDGGRGGYGDRPQRGSYGGGRDGDRGDRPQRSYGGGRDGDRGERY